jgi:murein L,D-transpeptidase YcbB/YkuD
VAVAAPATASTPSQIEAALGAGADSEVKTYYRYVQNRPLWSAGGTIRPEAGRVVALLRAAPLDGMADGPDRASQLSGSIDRARSGNPQDLARAEVELSAALAAYVRTLRRPAPVGITYIDPNLAPTPLSARTILNEAAAAPSLSRHLDRLPTLNPLYAQMRKGLADWQNRWAELPRVPVPSGPSFGPGSSGKRVEALRQRLGVAPGSSFDGELSAAVEAFKTAHGLPATRQVDATTLEMLNTSPALVEQRLRLNLDRARMLPATGRYVLVDAASARLWLFEDGAVRDSMKVIVGKPGEQTPMLAGLIRTAVFNPFWNVPPDIVRRRIAPIVLKDGFGYLRGKRYEVMSDWSDKAAPIDPAKVDWKSVAAGRTDVRVRQLPGGDNAMGAMKFMFPNDFGVYLHDTPEKALFGSTDRAQSSGCIRLEDAPRLASWLFGGAPRPRSDKAEQTVALPQPVPLYVNYFTAGWDGERFALRSDPYGRDRRVESASLTKLTAR